MTTTNRQWKQRYTRLRASSVIVFATMLVLLLVLGFAVVSG